MHNKRKTLFSLTLLLCIALTISGCSMLDSFVKRVKGQLVGESFVVSVYDDYGNSTVNLSGSHISIGNYEGRAKYDADGNEISNFKSEVLDITVDGHQMLHVGSSMVFEESGLNKLVDFNTEVGTDSFTSINAVGNGGFIPVDRLLNRVSHMLGKGKTIVVSSQMGVPMMVYEGDNVFIEVPEDLPKMTRITIDGKSLYLHRVEYQIYDTEMIN